MGQPEDQTMPPDPSLGEEKPVKEKNKLWVRWRECDKTEDGGFVETDRKIPLGKNLWFNFLFWLDQTEWLWDWGILKDGNWLYRVTFGRGYHMRRRLRDESL